MQSSLLGDFLFDSALESCPEMNVAEQRLLSDALAHASVDVLVGLALRREEEKRQREGQRLAKLLHEMRNAATAAHLAFDLLEAKGATADSKPGRALLRSLSQLREKLEDPLFDEVLSRGGLQLSQVKLAPVLAGARAQIDGRNVKVLVSRPREELRIEADARLLRPAVRGLVEAAVSIARPGSTIRVGALRERDRARVAVFVDECRKLRGNRLPELPSLDFARRAARAHGGTLSTRVSSPAGCEFRLDLPCVQPH